MDTFKTESNDTHSVNTQTTPPPPHPVGIPSPIISHNTYFKIHKSFESDNNKLFCIKLLNGVNKVFRQTTNRKFSYKELELTDEFPSWGSSIKLPDKDFDVIIHLIPPSLLGYHGGSCLNNDGNIVVVYGIYNLDNDPSQTNINVVCHEIAHGFGVAIGEYYTTGMLVDFTGVSPEFKVNTYIEDDYWHNDDHKEWLNDPMLIGTTDNPKFSWFSSWIITSGKYREIGPPAPDLESINVNLQYQGQPIPPNYKVGIWRNSKVYQDKIGDFATDNNGSLTFPWKAGINNNIYEALSDNFRIIKVFNRNALVCSYGLSIWDVQKAYIKSDFLSSYCVFLKGGV